VHERRHEHGARTNASRNTAPARPTPNSLITRWPWKMNEPKTRIMIVAAAVMTRPVSACPIRTERALSPVCTHSSCMRLTRNTW